MSTHSIKSTSPEAFPSDHSEKTKKRGSFGKYILKVLNTTPKKVVASVAAGAAIVAPIAIGLNTQGNGNGEGPNVGPNPIETEVKLTFEQELMRNLQDRPAVGTPEYDMLFDSLTVPYVENQPSEEVVQTFVNSIQKWFELGVDDLPDTGRAIVEYQAATGKSIDDLLAQIDVSYYDQGAADALYGEGWDATEFGQYSVSELSKDHRDTFTFILTDQIAPVSTNTVTDARIDTSRTTTTDIFAIPQLKITGKVDRTGELSLHLKAVDINNDGTPDEWHLVDNA